jgi:hypothetical protein
LELEGLEMVQAELEKQARLVVAEVLEAAGAEFELQLASINLNILQNFREISFDHFLCF